MTLTPVDRPAPQTERRTPVRAAVAFAVGSLVLLLLVAVSWGPLISFDQEIARTTHRWAVAEGGLTHAFRILTDWVWDPLTMRLLCAAVIIWLVWRRRAWFTATCLLMAVAVSTLVQQGLKAAVGRERPVWPDPVDSAHYAAFPSGHAMTATVVLGLLVWLLHYYGASRRVLRWATAIAAVSIIGVGLTRVWLGVHWPSDVLGGWLLGGMVIAAAITVHERWGPARP
ncbi:phosphatase PAP2 family protein [Streptomyces sp. NPDC048290]|uniref:phosphatase PAP2 family protein n=1 Tax=Streptomyces sp. NPDC048290 TaxID=3155811 RepID=UPI003416CF63